MDLANYPITIHGWLRDAWEAMQESVLVLRIPGTTGLPQPGNWPLAVSNGNEAAWRLGLMRLEKTRRSLDFFANRAMEGKATGSRSARHRLATG